MRGESPEQIEARVAEMLDLVGLAGYNRRRVYELTQTGVEALHGQRRDWERFSSGVAAVLGAAS